MKRFVRLSGILIAVVLVVALSLPLLVDANQFRPALESALRNALGRDVRVGTLKLAFFSGGVTADDLSVADDPAYSRDPFLRAASVALGVDLWQWLVSRKLHITRLTIERPRIDLLQSSAGDWNISTLGGKPAGGGKPAAPKARVEAPGRRGLDLSIQLVRIEDGRVSAAQMHGGGRPGVLEHVNLEVRNFSTAAAFPFTFSGKVGGGGEIKINGTAGPIDSTDAVLTPVKLALKISGLDLASAGLVENAAGLAGILSLDGSGASNGRILTLQANVKVERLKVARNGSAATEPVRLDVSLEHDFRKRAGVLRRGRIYIGSAAAGVTGTYAQRGESTVIDMSLAGPHMPVPQLAAMLPAMGIVLPAGSSLEGGTADASLTFQGPAALLVTSGTVALNNTRLVGFDLGSKVSTVARLAGIKSSPNTDIQILAANLRMAPEGMSAQDVKLVAPAIGELTGGGTVSPTHALDFRMRALMRTAGALMAALGQKGDTSVPFLIQGTASQPVFRPDVRSFAEDKLRNLKDGKLGKAADGLLDSVFGRKGKQ